MKLDSAKLLCSSDRVKRAGDDKDLILREWAGKTGDVSIQLRKGSSARLKTMRELK